MKTASKNLLRWLRVCHMLTASLWFGGVAATFVLLRAGVSDALLLYPRLVLPAAFLTLLEGLIYGMCTPWKFFRFRWIAAKWVIVLAIALCAIAGNLWRAGPEWFSLAVVGAQAVLLAAIMVISVLKPGGRKILLFAPPKKERTDEELRESIEKDRRPL